MLRSARAMLSGAAVSLIVHLVVALCLPRAVDVPRDAREPDLELEVRFDHAGDATSQRVAGQASVAVPGGADAEHNVDSRDRGRGGDAIGASSVILLLPRADAITLTDAPMNALGIGQTQRIETARDRASGEDRRATPSPADDPFLASGTGEHRERRPLATTDARDGARAAPEAGTQGAPLPGASAMASSALADAHQSDGPESELRTPDHGVSTDRASGAAQTSPGLGILDGRGARASESASVAHGRPTLDEAHAATTTEARDARVRDDTDAELLAARMMQSVVESTQRRGRIEGDGRGGVEGAGATGTGGGTREGGQARALGPGTGSWDALDTGDQRYQRWFVELRRRVENGMVFPRERQLAMEQGTSVYAIVVRRDGSLARAPRLLRSSGFSDLDGAALAAIRRAAPYSPLPDALVPGLRSITVTLPLEFSNPMTH